MGVSGETVKVIPYEVVDLWGNVTAVKYAYVPTDRIMFSYCRECDVKLESGEDSLCPECLFEVDPSADSHPKLERLFP